MKKKLTLDDIGKYSGVDDVEKLSVEDRKELYQECIKGRTCFLSDIGEMFENAYDEDGNYSCLKL